MGFRDRGNVLRPARRPAFPVRILLCQSPARPSGVSRGRRSRGPSRVLHLGVFLHQWVPLSAVSALFTPETFVDDGRASWGTPKQLWDLEVRGPRPSRARRRNSSRSSIACFRRAVDRQLVADVPAWAHISAVGTDYGLHRGAGGPSYQDRVASHLHHRI